MNKRILLILIAGFFTLSTLSVCFESFAQPTSTAKSKKKGKKKGKKKQGSKEDKEKAEHYQQQALTLFEKGDYEGALAFLLKAEEVFKTSISKLYIAKCYEKLYKYNEAYQYYQKYVDSGDKASFDEVIEAISRIESMPVILKVITEPEGAEVFIDGNKVTYQKTPVVSEVEPGKHTVVIKKKGFKDIKRNIKIPYGGTEKIEVDLVTIGKPMVVPEKPEAKKPEMEKEIKQDVVLVEEKKEKPAPVEEKKKETPKKVKLKKKARLGKPDLHMSFSFAAGATVSTSRVMGSYIDASIGIFFKIKEGFVGLSVDNMFFLDGYFVAAYPAGGYTLKVWRDLSLSFAAGFGFAYLQAFKAGASTEGEVAVEKGGHWDLVAHGDVKVRYKVGPVIVQAIPISADVLIGVGTINPAPLVQFAFLVGIAYEF